ncbi:MAG: integration host factor subunit alpha [Desulfobacterales bacterium]|nr:integration host factor subunit alpha [Desulfobacterales bacterium]
MPLTKAQIVNSIYNRLDISKNTSIEVVESLLEIIKRTLANGEGVLISGFGKFCVKDKGKRKVRNPQTGEDMMLGSKRVVTFRCSRVLRNRINGES